MNRKREIDEVINKHVNQKCRSRCYEHPPTLDIPITTQGAIMSSETIYHPTSCTSVAEYNIINHIPNSSVTMKSEEKTLKQRLIEYKEKNPTDKVIKDKKLLQEVLDYPIDLPVKQKICAIIS